MEYARYTGLARQVKNQLPSNQISWLPTNLIMCRRNVVICTFHCNAKIFTLNSPPQRCPICQKSFGDEDFSIPPFAIESPIVRAQEKLYCILVIPIRGHFLQDFKIGDLLHIGISNGRGEIIEYDKKGVRKRIALKKWDAALAIDLNQTDNDDWDCKLEEIVNNPKWSMENYHPSEHNCFDFVLAFLNSLQKCGSKYTKVTFCNEYVLPKLKMLQKYSLVYQKLCHAPNVIVQNKEIA